MSIFYTNNIDKTQPEKLKRFFVGWPNKPDLETHFKILKNSFAVWIALDGDRCVGFINAISDKIFYSFIPLLEVLPEYQGRGIGTELLNRMIDTLDKMYAIDIVCDDSISEFYQSKGFRRSSGMVKRNYLHQSGK